MSLKPQSVLLLSLSLACIGEHKWNRHHHMSKQVVSYAARIMHVRMPNSFEAAVSCVAAAAHKLCSFDEHRAAGSAAAWGHSSTYFSSNTLGAASCQDLRGCRHVIWLPRPLLPVPASDYPLNTCFLHHAAACTSSSAGCRAVRNRRVPG